MYERLAMNKSGDNEQAAAAGKDPQEKNAFLENNRQHILSLARAVSKRHLTMDDDEWSAAFLAVSEAIDEYTAERGDFWPFAAVVIRSRLLDLGRKQARLQTEIPVQPAAFDGEVDEDESNLSAQAAVSIAAVKDVDLSLKEEIETVGEEFARCGFSFFDLAGCSPKSFLTKAECAKAVRAVFTPPPLTGEIRKSGMLPIREITKRTGQPRKLLDRHRKYLVAASLILSGDYPGLQEYFRYMKVEKKA